MKALRSWFLKHRRPLPWRDNPSPYAVWVSEIMLQQTQVCVVIPYFERWMARFPTIPALAQADLAEVIKAWEGLGYYSRARNLHAGAVQICEEFGGQLPSTAQELASIKGIGPYTVGAILSFAFHQKAAAVDGNVIRVISRYLGIEGDVSKPRAVRGIREATEQLLPDERPWEVMEGLIELGATLCQRSPKCLACPLAGSCQKRTDLPFNSKKQSVTQLTRLVAVVTCGDHVLLRRGEEGKVMADLYEFPYFDVGPEEVSFRRLQELMGQPVEPILRLDPITHTFTRFRATLHTWHLEAEERWPGHWVPFTQLDQLPFSSGHRKVKRCLEFASAG